MIDLPYVMLVDLIVVSAPLSDEFLYSINKIKHKTANSIFFMSIIAHGKNYSPLAG